MIFYEKVHFEIFFKCKHSADRRPLRKIHIPEVLNAMLNVDQSGSELLPISPGSSSRAKPKKTLGTRLEESCLPKVDQPTGGQQRGHLSAHASEGQCVEYANREI